MIKKNVSHGQDDTFSLTGLFSFVKCDLRTDVDSKICLVVNFFYSENLLLIVYFNYKVFLSKKQKWLLLVLCSASQTIMYTITCLLGDCLLVDSNTLTPNPETVDQAPFFL